LGSVGVAGTQAATEPAGARQRILAAAYALFSQHGVAAVGIDAIIARSGTAKMSLYRHFGSKDELVLAFLRQREQEWTRSWLEAAAMARATEPEARLLAIFDVFHEWFQADDFEGSEGWQERPCRPRGPLRRRRRG
jgi:AcrR family transcriptional regulator